MTEIGNVGVNGNDMESKAVHCKGVLVRNYNENYSNYRAEGSFADLLKKNNAIGICDIDTRFLTKMIRDEGAMMMIASTEISDKDELAKILKSSPRIEDINYIKIVSTKEAYKHNFAAWDHVLGTYKPAPKTNKKIHCN